MPRLETNFYIRNGGLFRNQVSSRKVLLLIAVTFLVNVTHYPVPAIKIKGNTEDHFYLSGKIVEPWTEHYVSTQDEKHNGNSNTEYICKFTHKGFIKRPSSREDPDRRATDSNTEALPPGHLFG